MEPITVKVKCDETETGYMIINESDFIEGEHEIYEEGPGDDPSRDEMKALLTERGVAFPNNIKAEALSALYAAEKAKAD